MPLDRAEGAVLEGFIKEVISKNRSKSSIWKGNRGVLGEGNLVCLEDGSFSEDGDEVAGGNRGR